MRAGKSERESLRIGERTSRDRVLESNKETASEGDNEEGRQKRETSGE